MNVLAAHDAYLPRIAQAIALQLKAGGPQAFGMGITQAPQPLVTTIKAGPYNVASSIIEGPMFLEGDFFSQGMRGLFNAIDEADKDASIQGHYVTVNTGGGAVTAGQEGHSIFSGLTKPVLVHTNYMCSAGIMATATASEIMLFDEMSTVGSVGILASYPKWFLEIYDEVFIDIYPDSSKRKREEFKALKSGDLQPTKDSLAQLDRAFMSLVKKYRPRATKEARSGAVFTGREAINQGLADSIGNRSKALKRLQTLIKTA